MSSDVSICNQALGLVGAATIISFNDDSKQAALCKEHYAPIRDAVLESSNWSFAIKRKEIPASATAPAFGYANAYPLPSDVLRVIDVNQRKADSWALESREILTDDNECKIKYITRVEDPALFSALFEQALVARLAAEFAIPLTQSRSLQKQHFDIFLAKMREATARDGLQGTSPRIRTTWLERARVAGGKAFGPTV